LTLFVYAVSLLQHIPHKTHGKNLLFLTSHCKAKKIRAAVITYTEHKSTSAKRESLQKTKVMAPNAAENTKEVADTDLLAASDVK